LPAEWTARALDLTAFRGAVVQLRFRLQTAAAPEGDTPVVGAWTVDQLVVQDAPPLTPTTTPTVLPSATALPAATPTPLPTATEPIIEEVPVVTPEPALQPPIVTTLEPVEEPASPPT